MGPTNTNYGSTVETFVYDADGNMTADMDPMGNPATCDPSSNSACPYTTYTTYDADGNQLELIEPPVSGGSSQSVSTSSYDPSGNQVLSVDPIGVSENTTFDNLANSIATSLGSDQPTTSTFDADGNLLTRTSPATATASRGITSAYTYDGDGNVLTETDSSLDLKTTYAYDADGNQVCETDPNATAAGYTCNSASPPTAWSTGLTFNAYDGDGNLTETTAPASDSLGTGYSTWYYYDSDGNQVAETDSEGNGNSCNPLTSKSLCADTSYSYYDEAGYLTSSAAPPNPTSPNTWQTTTYTNDADGNVLTTTDPNGNVTSNSWDGADEITNVSYVDNPTYSDESTPPEAYTYNADGALTSITDGTGTTTLAYDQQQNVISATSGAGDTTTYGYDAAGNTQCISYPGAAGTCASATPPSTSCSSTPNPSPGIVEYQYRPDGLPCKVTDWLGGTFSYNYDSALEETSLSVAGPTANVTETNSFDAAGRLDAVQVTSGSSTLLGHSYGLDGNGDIVTDTPAVAGVQATETYSPVNSAGQASGYGLSPNPSNISYDSGGQLSSDGSQYQASSSLDGQLCWTAASGSAACDSPPSGSTTYTYNPDGEVIGKSGGTDSTYGWDAAGGELMCENTDGSSCSTSSPSAATTTFSYDAQGNLASWTSGTSGAQTTTQFTWSSGNNSNLLASAQSGAAGSLNTDYVYGPDGSPLEQVETSPSGVTNDMLLSNGLGDIDGLVRLSGSAANTLANYTDYGPYGEPESSVSGEADGGLSMANLNLSSSFTDTTLLGFAGGLSVPQLDGTGTALVMFNNALVYDPNSGTSTSGSGWHFRYNYNRRRAKRYIGKWWNRWNETRTNGGPYPELGDDCTDFGSQVLLAGRLPEFPDLPFLENGLGFPKYDPTPGYWFMLSSFTAPRWAVAWTVAFKLLRWMTHNEQIGIQEPALRLLPGGSNLKSLPSVPYGNVDSGDMMFTDLGYSGRGAKANHLDVVQYRQASGQDGDYRIAGTMVAQHTVDHHDTIWNLYDHMRNEDYNAITSGTKYYFVHVKEHGTISY